MDTFYMKTIAGRKYHKEPKKQMTNSEGKICIKRTNDKTIGQNANS